MLLVVAMGGNCPAGEDCVDVMAKHVVNGEIEYIFNRMYENIYRFEDGLKSAWFDAGCCTWLTNELSAAFFVLAYLLSRCDFHPRVPLFLKALRTMRLFPSSIIVNRPNRLTIHCEEKIKIGRHSFIQ